MYNVKYYDNDLFFVCWMIERISRTTHNTTKDIVNKLGKNELLSMYKFASVMHCENPLAVEHEFITENNIQNGSFDNVSVCRFNIPLETAMGKLYMRLIMNTFEVECNWKDYETNINHKEDLIEHLIVIYNSWISDVIENYNTTMFTESPKYIYDCYVASDILG